MKRHLALLLTLMSGAAFAAPPALTPPDTAALREARALVESMKQKERGPYSRLRWFCNDGSVQPPTPFACAERGGGRQHAEYSVDRQRLAELGWHVGTVVAALTWEELWQPQQRLQRLRELPLERYLESVDDGWVLRLARDYRGRLQIEDEESTGRELLLKLLAQPGFIQENFLLAREVARVVPHGTQGSDRTGNIRHLAQQIAETEPGFARLRIEIHSHPSAASAGRVRAWTEAGKATQAGTTDKARRLADELDQLYGQAGRRYRLESAAKALAKHSPEATRLIREAQKAPPFQHIERLSLAIEKLRLNSNEKAPTAGLLRLDLLTELEAELRTSALERLESNLSRRELLILARDLLRASWGLGLISEGERQALMAPLEQLLAEKEAGIRDYAFLSRRLSLPAAWATQTVRHTFAEALVRYTALEPRAERFIDDLLRDSLLLPLGELAHRLRMDGAQAAGISHRFFDAPAEDLLGINPGIARGRLRILEADELARGLQPGEDEIVVLTETLAELSPVAGILTLGEGNPLSHVQMLARNLGIPNVALNPKLLTKLRAHGGEQVTLAVASDGRVLLERSEASRSPQETAVDEPVPTRVDTPLPDLSNRHPIPLAELHAGLAGRVVGPKAANVGQLKRLFPERITPAIALPFGVFAEHTVLPRQRVAQAFQRFRAGELDQAGLDAELEAVRQTVAGISLQPALAAELRDMMLETFGPPGSYGVFVRSDTNAEDLPEFTGAGLNQTLPHVVGLSRQQAAVSQVWSSVYSRRAMAWRARILNNPEAVFASVLLMKSVPSEKSGVLVTSDLNTGGPGLTVSVAWGVGGAVDNESAASRVLRADGGSLILSEAKAPYRRALAAEGGIEWLPANIGPVLSEAELVQLRALAQEVRDRYPPATDSQGQPLPWDIEFAFAEGRLWLLQIRPLKQRGSLAADLLLNSRLPRAAGTGTLSLDEPPLTAAGG